MNGEPASLREAFARLRAPDACEAFSPLTGAPFLAVVLDGDPPDDGVPPALAEIPAPSIALLREPASAAARRIAACFDLAVASEDDLARAAAAVRATPRAAATLAQLLRHAEARSIEAGLVAESLAYAALQGGPEHRAWLASRDAEGKPHADERAPLRVERRGAALDLTFDRSPVRNAYSASLRDALVEALQLAVADAAIERVVLAGAGPAFCAGGDLAEFGAVPDPVTGHLVRTTRSAARLLARLAPRVEARVHGACVGAGTELAAFASRVVARPDAWFALPELAMGLVPGAGGTVSVPRRIGRQRAFWMALTGARIDAATALRWRLVDAIEPEGEARAR